MANENILIGYAKVWSAPVGETLPDETSIAYGADWGGNWVYLGDTLEPLELSFDVEKFDVDIQQALAPVKSSRTAQKPMIKSVLAENTVLTLQKMLGGTATPTAAGVGQVGFTEFKFGGETAIDFFAWGFEVVYVDADGVTLPVRYFYHRGSITLDGSISFAKDAAAGIPFEITVLDDTSQPVGEQTGIIHYITAPATS